MRRIYIPARTAFRCVLNSISDIYIYIMYIGTHGQLIDCTERMWNDGGGRTVIVHAKQKIIYYRVIT